MRDNQYFHTAPSDIYVPEGFLFLRGDEAHHCTHVLRKRGGDEFYVVDGIGTEYVVAVEDMARDGVRCRILESATRPRELPVALTLGMALLKKDHFDLVVEKATELGVTRILPLRTARCVRQTDDRRVERWRRMAVEAMKQSRRSVCPLVSGVTGFGEFLGLPAGTDSKIICHEGSRRPVHDSLSRPSERRSAWILVGPEGGFTDDEVRQAENAGWISVSLGPRRLKAETAALCALSIFAISHSL